jgi:ribonuclease Z
MEPFRVHILGCGSALPTLKHNPSSQIVEIRGKCFLIDCGEGTQTQLRRSKIKFTRISAVFISHVHGDHCFGLIGMVSTFGMLGRTAPLHIYAPAGFSNIMKMQIDFFCKDLEYEVVFHDVDTNANNIIYEDRSLTVETVPLSHRVPCCGFIFREKQTLPHILRDMTDYYKVPVSQFNNIKNGADWVDEEGNVIPYTRLTTPSEPARSYAYCSDTKYLPMLHECLKDVCVLYHESTYSKEDEDMAKMYFHSTAAQAAQVASDANVGKLVLGHYSARYEDENRLLEEAKNIFPNTVLSDEGLIIDV